jgi:hypothetical protein
MLRLLALPRGTRLVPRARFGTKPSYADAVKQAREQPAEFWGAAAAGIDWAVPFRTVMSGTRDRPDWFAGGELSVCHNALDRHVTAGHTNKVGVLILPLGRRALTCPNRRPSSTTVQ